MHLDFIYNLIVLIGNLNRIELENRPGVSKRLHAVDTLQVVAEAAGGVGLVRLVGADQANVDALVRPPDTRMSLK